jgi:hypothetical protein
MFALRWYGVASSSTHTTSENAWHGLTTIRWLMLLTIAVTLASTALRISQRSHGAQTDPSLVVTVLGGVLATLLVYRVLVDLPGDGAVLDQKLGAIFGVVASLGIAFGGYEWWREARKSARTVVQRSRKR